MNFNKRKRDISPSPYKNHGYKFQSSSDKKFKKFEPSPYKNNGYKFQPSSAEKLKKFEPSPYKNNGYKFQSSSAEKLKKSEPSPKKEPQFKLLDSKFGDFRKEVDIVSKNETVRPGFEKGTHQLNEKEENLNEMWVNKYKPKTVGKIIGQSTPASPANKLRIWLKNWFSNKNAKAVWNSKNENGIGLKAALLSGPPGIGKTTTAQLVSKECGFEFVEFNASDTRNKKSMDEQIMSLLDNKTMDKFFHDPTHNAKMTTKHVLIMDEVDGMGGNADKGGIAELIQFIKKTRIPIICICNDRNSQKIRNLANHCFDLRFSKPRVEQIKGMMLSICFKEGVKVDPKLLSEIIEMSNHDIRQVIHYFSVFTTKNENLSDIENHKIIKDVTLGPFEAVNKLFTAVPECDKLSFNDKSNLFFNDHQLIPLFVWENYLKCKSIKSANEIDSLKLATKSIDAICISDIIETQIRTTQNWSLFPLQAAFSTALPGCYMNGHFSSIINFPSLLGKISSTNKKDRLVNELKQHMNLKITGSKTCLNLDYIKPLRDRLIQPLIEKGTIAVDKVIQTLNHYFLLKDDLDSIIELSLWGDEKSPFLNVDTKTKAALTRTFNQTCIALPYADKDMIKKIGKDGKKNKYFPEENQEEKDNATEWDEIILPDF